MNLTHSQKKYLKKNLKRLSLNQIATNLNVTENEILQYLKNNWSKDKYRNFLKNQSKNHETSLSLSSSYEGRATGFNFKNFFNQNWKVFIFFSFLVLGIYANTIKSAFLSDDIFGILENKNIGNLSYYLKNQPLIFLRSFFYFIIYKISDLNVIPYHLLNIFFHLGSVWLVYLLFSFLATPIIAFFAAGIFAVHPILTESITWISGGPYSQYGFFLLLAFWFYLLSRKQNWQIKNYLLSFLAFFLALFTTEKAVVLPLILFLFEFSFKGLRKNWKRLIFFFLISFVWIILFFVLGAVKGRISSLENQYYQSVGYENPFVQIPIALSSYLRLIFWPDKLTLYHSELTFTKVQYFMMLIITLAFFVFIGWAYKKNRQIFFWSSFFIIVLSPTLTPLRIGWVVAERYVYLASLGIIFLIALVINKIGKITKKPTVAFIIFAILLLAFSTRTIIRNIDWYNQDNLWLSAAKTSPSSHQNHNNLGDLYARHGDYQKAVEEFQKAIELKPNYGDAYHNIANVYHQMGRDDLAEQNYQKALSFNPNLWQSYQNLAAIHFNQKNYQLSREELEKAVQINPESADLHANLGILYLNLNDKQKAREEFEKTLQIDPQNQKAQQQLKLMK